MRGAQGIITDIIGVVLNARFPEDGTPEIYNAIEIPLDSNTGGRLVAEVQQHLGGGVVKAVAMSTTDVPIPVPTLNARASSSPIGGRGFVAPSHIASATSPTYT